MANDDVPADDGRRRRHAFITPDEPAPVLVGAGALLTRQRAIEALRALRSAGGLKANSVELIDYEETPVGDGKTRLSVREAGTVDTRYPAPGSDEFRSNLREQIANSNALGASVNPAGGSTGLGEYLARALGMGSSDTETVTIDSIAARTRKTRGNGSNGPKDAA